MVQVRALDRTETRRLAAFLLGPVAATMYALAVWRFAAAMNWFGGEFIIPDGIFSRWQVWLAIGAALQSGAHQLSRVRSR